MIGVIITKTKEMYPRRQQGSMHYWKFCQFLQIVPLMMLWTLAKCLLSLQLSEKAFGHILQPYGFSPKNTVFQSFSTILLTT